MGLGFYLKFKRPDCILWMGKDCEGMTPEHVALLKALIAMNTHERIYIGASYDELYLYGYPTIKYDLKTKKIYVELLDINDRYYSIVVGEITYDEYGDPWAEITMDEQRINEFFKEKMEVDK